MPADATTKRYEANDLRPRRFLIGLILGIGAFFTLGFVLMRFYLSLLHATSGGTPRSIAAERIDANDAPPLQPQVGHDQVDAQDLAEMRAHETAVFDKLGWRWDEAKQARTIPVAVIEAVRHRVAATQPVGAASAERGAK